MTHDRTRISALVDGECSVDEREAVLAHVMGCDDCRAFYQQERAAKSALSPDPAVGVTAPVALVSALLAMAPGQARATDRPAVRRPRSTGPARPAELPGQRRRRIRRAAKGIAFSLIGASLLVATAFVIGGDAGAGVATPALTAFGAEHEDASSVARDAADASSAVATSTWPTGSAGTADLVLPALSLSPSTLAGFTLVSAAAAERGAIRSTYTDGSGTVSVFRQDGRLGTAKLKGFSKHRVDGVKLERKVGRPAYLVWNCSGVTYTLVGDSTADLDRMAVALPHRCTRANGWSRVGRGMHRAAGWLNPLS
jgi:anti-sigma factor RsiW